MTRLCTALGTALTTAALSLLCISANAASIAINGQLSAVLVDEGSGAFANTPVRTPFSGFIDDVNFNGQLGNGTTTVAFGCCIAAGGLEVFNNEVLDADTAALLNQLAGTSMYSAGDLIDSINIEGDVATAGGGRIEIGISYLFDPDTFTDTSSSNYPFDPSLVRLAAFFILEENASGDDIYDAVGLLPAAPNPRDFNADGKSDLIWQNAASGQRLVWFLDGTAFQGSANLGTLGTAWQFAGSADLNNDGEPDIVLQNTATGDRYVWFMNGTGIAGASFIANVPVEWQIAVIRDYNGDGRPDFVFQNTATGQRVVWFMNGTAYAGSADFGILSAAWQFVGGGDFNNDGMSDLVLQNTATGDRYVWLLNGTSIIGSVFLGNVATAWDIAGTGDFNADGKPDLIWQNTVTGDRYVWFMNGASFAGGASLGNVATDWQIAP